ncbi:MAG TPA: TIGR02281 family clan AA aspartic protease [Xanthobacteraceae bacterium]|jgi:aspartyl protease family protein|nr:TIGR02281 family clan AA aspartic protease [Xanthobacteraceae bacterium]
MRSVLIVAAVALIAAVMVPRYFTQRNTAHPAPAMMAARPVAAPQPAPADSRSVVVSRNSRGHFQLDARVDGRRLPFMVDTGASVIALTADDAATLGIHPSASAFTALVKTANGVVRAAPVELDRVEIEDITVRNVAAMVLPDGALSENLLGMSFLSRLHRWEFADGKLVLEQ